MKKTRRIALIMSIVMVMFAFAGMSAFADDSAAAQPAMQVYTQAGADGTPELVKSYTAEELASLASEMNAAGYVYQYYKNNEWNGVVATSIVKLDTLLSDAGVAFAAGDSLKQESPDGFIVILTQKQMDENRYFFDPSKNGESTEVPTGLAVEWEEGNIAEGYADIAQKAKNTGKLRFVMGTTEALYNGTTETLTGPSETPAYAAGYRLGTNITKLTVIQGAEISKMVKPNKNNTSSAPAAATSFKDVAAGCWYEAAVKEMTDKKIISGYSESEFGPNDNITRAQFVSLLYRIEGSPAAGKAAFTDVAADAWYAPAVAWASDNKIVSGVTDTTFNPDDKITREQLAKMLYGYAQLKGKGFVGEWMFLLEQTDAASVSDWANEAVHWCVMNNIVTGNENNQLCPKDSATRAQAAVMLQRFTAV